LTDQNIQAKQLQSARDWRVRAILELEFPLWQVYESLANVAKVITKDTPQPDLPLLQQVANRRLSLNALATNELEQLHCQLKAANDSKAEATRFYNQSKAKANFGHWLSMDFWTLDDAVALLLGKNPTVVNKTTIAQDLEKPKGFFGGVAKPATRFTNLFSALQLSAERSNEMTASPRLAPRDVARWGASVIGQALPPPLLALLSEQSPDARLQRIEAPLVPVTVPVTVPATGTGTDPAPVSVTAGIPIPTPMGDAASTIAHDVKPVFVNRAALLALAPVWQTVDNDLHHSHRNGLAEAAKAEGRNQWDREAAIQWAVSKGKIKPKAAQLALPHLPPGFFGT